MAVTSSGDPLVFPNPYTITTTGSTLWNTAGPYVPPTVVFPSVSGGHAPGKWEGWSADDIIDLFAKDLALKRPA